MDALYRLQTSIRRAIDAGVNHDWMLDAQDLDGMSRILYGRVSATADMGAYEMPPPRGSMFLFR